MQKYKKLLLATSFGVIATVTIQGQNTNSPYSRYGYGVLDDQAIGASKGMGGISYGVQQLSVNPGNPASYAGVDSLTFIYDIGVSYNKAWLSQGDNKEGYNNGGLDYIAMQYLLSKKVGMSIGLLPFSSVGYQFGSTDKTGSVSSLKTFAGSGNISEIYGGLAYSPIKNLSIGANIAYVFGNTTYNRTLDILNVSEANIETWYHKLSVNMMKLDFGVQYVLPVNKDNKLILGAVFSPKVKSSGKIESIHNVYTSAGVNIPAEGDTLSYRGNNAPTDLPMTLGAGFTWSHKENLIFGGDITYQNWEKTRYSQYMQDQMETGNRFNNRWRFNGGVEYSIAPRERGFVKRMKFRGGLNYANSYINVMDSEKQLSGYKEYGATIGFGFPFLDTYTRRTSYINVNFEYKNISPNKSHLVKEQYFGISLGVCLNDLWFMKSKIR